VLTWRKDEKATMRLINALLLVLVVVLQFKLWFGDGGLRDKWQLEAAVLEQQADNASLLLRNKVLASEVWDLKNGTEALEERARNELGLVEPDQEFFQVVESPAKG
jgi:cell division protein FtsB